MEDAEDPAERTGAGVRLIQCFLLLLDEEDEDPFAFAATTTDPAPDTEVIETLETDDTPSASASP